MNQISVLDSLLRRSLNNYKTSNLTRLPLPHPRNSLGSGTMILETDSDTSSVLWSSEVSLQHQR